MSQAINAPLVTLEFTKMRGRKQWLIVIVTVLAAGGLTLVTTVASPDFGDPPSRRWEQLLASLKLAYAMTVPMMVAALTSRQVEIEHVGNGWLAQRTAGIHPGALCRAKFVACALSCLGTLLLTTAGVIGFGAVVGMSAPFDPGLWLGFFAGVAVVTLSLVTLHVAVAAVFDNQLVGLGIGVVGTMLALFSKGMPTLLQHLTPWGYFGRVGGAEYQGETLVSNQPSVGSMALLAVISAGVFMLWTLRLDRQEG